MNLRIYGVSDDLVEVEGDLNEEYYAESMGPLDGKTLTLSRIHNGQVEGMDIHVRYEMSGTWSVGISQLMEGVPLPDWGMDYSVNEYSAVLNLTRVPEDVRMTATEKA